MPAGEEVDTKNMIALSGFSGTERSMAESSGYIRENLPNGIVLR